MLKGIIIVNPFGIPGQSIKQAQRLVQEFSKKGVETTILSNAFLRVYIENNKIENGIFDVDFAVFLDKDKYLSAMLNKVGVKLFNSHNAIRLCDDKGETYIALSNNGVNIPKTIFAPLCYSESCSLINEQITKVEKSFGYPLVVKCSYGSCGAGVYKADNRKTLVETMQKLKTSPHMFQEYLGKEFGKDFRIIVIGGKAVACMQRINENDFRSNIALGGKGKKIDITELTYKDYFSTAEKCADILGLDYCGVDILKGNDNTPVVCEVNSNAFFEEIEKVTKINVAEIYVNHIMNRLQGLKE